MSQATMKVLAVVIATAVTAGGYTLLPKIAGADAAAPVASAPAAAAKSAEKTAAKAASAPVAALTLDLPAALQQGRIRAEFHGRRDPLSFTAHNLCSQPLRLHLAAGQLFASAKSTVALTRACDLEIEPSARKSQQLATVATSSASLATDEIFTLSSARLPRLDIFFAWVAEHPELSQPAIQTAVLALTENLPVRAFARFATSDPATVGGVRADTADILAALLALRDAGLDGQLALTIDPQLKIEAMIDPLAHALALRYYAIGDEWAFWKNELLSGNPATRHYALYGIGRFYPDIALQMLPKWARTEGTPAVFRTSALQALAETQRPEALSALRQLESELGSDSALGKTAHAAANYLDAQFTRSNATRVTVAFRSSKTIGDSKPTIAAAN